MAERIRVRMRWKVMPYGEAHSSLGLENILNGPWCWFHAPKAAGIIKDQAIANMSGVASVDGSLVKDASMQDCPLNLNELAEVFRNNFFHRRGHRVTFGYVAWIGID
jgi:hypothetical protein